MHAYVLLKSNSGEDGANWSYEKICEAYNVGPVTMANIRERYNAEGLAAAPIERNRNESMNITWTEMRKHI
ncbi:MAG: hypothetical protein AB9907_17660 [Flexilinea sp.]